MSYDIEYASTSEKLIHIRFSILENRFNFDESELNAELNELLATSQEEAVATAPSESGGSIGGSGGRNALDMSDILESLPNISDRIPMTTAEPNEPTQSTKTGQREKVKQKATTTTKQIVSN